MDALQATGEEQAGLQPTGEELAVRLAAQLRDNPDETAFVQSARTICEAMICYDIVALHVVSPLKYGPQCNS